MDQLGSLLDSLPQAPFQTPSQTPKGFSMKKILFLFSALLALLVVAVGGYVFYSSAGGSDSSEPPQLALNTSSMAKGMASTNVKQIPGFAKFTDEDVANYECNPKFEITLKGRVSTLFAEQAITMKKIVSAIHPAAGAQYLVAYYAPTLQEAVKNELPGIENLKSTYVLYPTETSPFRGAVGITDGSFKIPAYRGFQIISDQPETLFCKGADFKTSTDNLWYTGKGEEISFEKTIDILNSIRFLPKGWVMLPAGSDTSTIGGFMQLLGKDSINKIYYQTDSGEFKEFNYDKDWDSVKEVGKPLVYNAVWFNLKSDVNVSGIVDDILEELEGPKKKKRKAPVQEEVVAPEEEITPAAEAVPAAEAAPVEVQKKVITDTPEVPTNCTNPEGQLGGMYQDENGVMFNCLNGVWEVEIGAVGKN